MCQKKYTISLNGVKAKISSNHAHLKSWAAGILETPEIEYLHMLCAEDWGETYHCNQFHGFSLNKLSWRDSHVANTVLIHGVTSQRVIVLTFRQSYAPPFCDGNSVTLMTNWHYTQSFENASAQRCVLVMNKRRSRTYSQWCSSIIRWRYHSTTFMQRYNGIVSSSETNY